MKTIHLMLQEILRWQGWENQPATLAAVLHVATDDVDSWLSGQANPTKSQARNIEKQHKDARRTHTRTLICKLECLRYRHKEIAAGIGLEAIAGVTHAREGDFCLTEQHFEKLQRFYETARIAALRTFINEISPDLEFGCALAGKQPLTVYKKSADLARKQSASLPITEGCSQPGLQGIVLVWRLPFQDDSKAFYEKTSLHKTPVISVMISDKLPIQARRQIVLKEFGAHIWDKILGKHDDNRQAAK
jgi:hypothetical protein